MIPARPGLGDDVVVDSGPLRAVIDGVTYKGDARFSCDGTPISGGRFAAVTVARALTEVDPDADAASVVDFCSQALSRAVHEQLPDIGPGHYPGCTAAVLNTVRDEVWWVGDPWVRVEFPTRLFMPDTVLAVDVLSAGVRRAVIEGFQAAGLDWPDGQDPGRAAIGDFLRWQSLLANTTGEFGYGVINGTPVPPELIGVCDVSAATRVVLATDGYPLVAREGVCSFDVAEQYLAWALEQDPWCVSILSSTKGLQPGAVSFDDRSWLDLVRSS